ncbi:DMT family transporter [Leptothoe sp. ISB3NOV94-8A]
MASLSIDCNMPTDSRTIGRLPIFYLAYLALGIIWGTNFLYMKWAAQLITPSQIVFLRVLFGFFPVLIYAILQQQIRRSHLKSAHHFLVMSLLATTLYFYCFAQGTALLNSGIAGALSGLIPIFSAMTATLFLREEKLSRLKMLGILVGFAGVLIIARPWSTEDSIINIYGVLFMMLGSLSVGISFIYAKKFLTGKQISPAALTSYQMLFALLSMTLITDLEGVAQIQSDEKALIGLVFGLGILGTGAAYILYYIIVNNLGAITASSVTYIPPIVALFIGFFIAGEIIVLADWLGMAIILIGVYILRLGTK